VGQKNRWGTHSRGKPVWSLDRKQQEEEIFVPRLPARGLQLAGLEILRKRKITEGSSKLNFKKALTQKRDGLFKGLQTMAAES